MCTGLVIKSAKLITETQTHHREYCCPVPASLLMNDMDSDVEPQKPPATDC